MPLWIPLALAGAKLAKSGFDYYQSVKRQKKATAAGELADTQTEAAQEAYLKHLGTQAKEGTVDVGGRLSGYSQDVYGGAQRASMSAKGQLIRSGMENSIAGIRATKEPFTKAGGMIGRKRLQLEGMNEETKRLAEERYAQSHLQFATQDTQRTEARTLQDINTTGQRNQALAGGLLSAGSTALSAFGPKAAGPPLGAGMLKERNTGLFEKEVGKLSESGLDLEQSISKALDRYGDMPGVREFARNLEIPKTSGGEIDYEAAGDLIKGLQKAGFQDLAAKYLDQYFINK